MPKDQSIFGLELRALGFTVKEIIRKLQVDPKGRNSHAFRHTYVIMGKLREVKLDPSVIAQSAGNTPITIYSNYAGQVSIDKQRRGKRAFDQMKNSRKSS
jgi:hypothetical protein